MVKPFPSTSLTQNLSEKKDNSRLITILPLQKIKRTRKLFYMTRLATNIPYLIPAFQISSITIITHKTGVCHTGSVTETANFQLASITNIQNFLVTSNFH